VLRRIIASHDFHDNSAEYKEDEFFQSFINLPRNVPIKEVDSSQEASDTGGSSSFHYGNVEKIESHARLVRFD